MLLAIRTRIRREWRGHLLFALVPLAFFATVAALGWFAGAFQYDTDEGLNLMKALLVTRGYSLYADIWSDQPPLYTLCLAGVFKLFGPSVLAARLLTTLFAAVLIASLCSLVRRLHSQRTALIAAALLIVSAWFARLSFSAMIGLPALAVATASLAVLARFAQRPTALSLTLSAVLMSAAGEIKLMALLAMPAAISLLFLAQPHHTPWARSAARAVAWLILVAACSVAMNLAFGVSFEQLLLGRELKWQVRDWGSKLTMLTLMRRDWDLEVLSLLSIAAVIWHPRARPAIAALLWLAIGAVAMQLHRPAWYHHSLLLVIPAAWAAAVTVDWLVELWSRHASSGRRSLPWVFPLVLIVAYESVKLVQSGGRLFVESHPSEKRIVEAMRARAAATRWAFADRLIYPFVAGLAVPPEAAVVSTKRRDAGQLSDQQVIGILRRYRPQQVLLARIEFGNDVTRYIQREYRLARSFKTGGGAQAKLYVRNVATPHDAVHARSFPTTGSSSIEK